jgi:alkylhydroperoxidase/carboxymuconolactone decarboxylase family protein YurZ
MPDTKVGRKHGVCLAAPSGNVEALSPVQREMITLSVLIVQAREPRLCRHLGNALNVGFTQDQVIEVFMHLTLYGGIPLARGAMDIANEIFING